MNNKVKIAAGLALLALVPTAAMAHTNLSIGLNLGGRGYYEPAPVYVAPPPPRVVYYEEAPRYYGPTVHYEYREGNRGYYHDRHDDRGYYGRDYDRR